MAEMLGWGVILAVVSLPGLLFPRAIWAMFGGLSYRTPERVEPSNRRYRVVRMGSATTLLVGIVVIVAALWPGTGDEKAVAAFTTALIGNGVFIGAVVLSIILRKRRESLSGRREETDDDLPPDEPSEISYGFDYFGIVVYLVLTLIISGSFIGFEQRKQERIDEIVNLNNQPLTPEQQEAVDETVRKWNTLHLDRYPVYADVPDGAVIALPRMGQIVDASTREPRKIWFQSETTYDVAPPMGIGEADFTISMPAFTCHVTGIVLQETAESVAVAFVVDGKNAVPKEEGTTVATCFGSPLILAQHFLIDLAEPLGAREMTSLGGGRIIKPFGD